MGRLQEKARRILCSVALLAAATAWSQGQDAKPSPQSRLETAIAEAVRLLEAKEYKKFLESFVAPDDLKRITEQVSLDLLADRFGRERADHMLKVLRSIEKAKPEIDSNSKTASFPVEEGLRLPGRQTLVFIHVNGLWYIRN